MPTGYTYKIVDGEDITPKEFILNCATQFGGMHQYSQQDRPQSLDEYELLTVRPSAYEKVRKAKEELDRILNTSRDEFERDLVESYAKRVLEYSKHYKEKKELHDRLTAFLNEVEAWEPPTPDHQDLKDFAIRQLTETIDWDADYEQYNPNKLQMDDLDEYIQVKIENAKHRLKVREESLEKEKKAVASRNNWVMQLYRSFDK